MNECKGKEQYRVEISNRSAALENLEAEVDINRAWETIGENIRWLQTAATCSRWFTARGFVYPEDGGDTFLRNVG
jgi:hypothetical protein